MSNRIRPHMDCYTGMDTCLLGDPDTCPFAPNKRSEMREQVVDYSDLAQFGENMTRDKLAWQREISDALELTWTELHGGGATIYAEREKCVEEINRLKAERAAGWEAAYQRGLRERTEEA